MEDLDTAQEKAKEIYKFFLRTASATRRLNTLHTDFSEADTIRQYGIDIQTSALYQINSYEQIIAEYKARLTTCLELLKEVPTFDEFVVDSDNIIDKEAITALFYPEEN